MKKKTIIVSSSILFLLIGLFIWGRIVNQPDAVASDKPLMGEVVANLARTHVPDGTLIAYTSNPPAGGSHYAKTAHAGIYNEPVSDGYLVHSLEHGAVIMWYEPNLPEKQIAQLKSIYNEASIGKKIMMPREGLGVPVALSSWGRVLRLSSINESEIKEFMETNYDRAPEKEPI